MYTHKHIHTAHTQRLMTHSYILIFSPPRNRHAYTNHHTTCMRIHRHSWHPLSLYVKCADKNVHVYLRVATMGTHTPCYHTTNLSNAMVWAWSWRKHPTYMHAPMYTPTHTLQLCSGQKIIPVLPHPHLSPCRMLRSNLITCVSNDTFAGLSSVRLLSLYDNRITTITPGAFTTLVSLSTM